MSVDWNCPKCEAPANGHGEGGAESCQEGYNRGCLGFLCVCDAADGDCGSYENPCENAVCYHCGWRGTFQMTPRKDMAWEKKALANGWTPPKGWQVQP